MVEYLIRELTDEDFSQAIDIIVDSFTVDGQLPDNYHIQKIRKRVISSFDNGEYASTFFVAVDNNQVLGISGLAKVEFASRTWTMFLDAVDKNFRDCGIGTALIKKRLEYIQENNNNGRILVSTNNFKRYEPFGFVIVDYDSDLKLHLMMKKF